jgi:predicted nuclease of predicted toxin-antitoxin system
MFLVDAQLPRRVADWLTAAGCDAKQGGIVVRG